MLNTARGSSCARPGLRWTYPNLLRERIEETKDARCLLHRLLDHNGNAQRHEGLGEVDDTLALRCYRQGRYGNVRLL